MAGETEKSRLLYFCYPKIKLVQTQPKSATYFVKNID